MAPRAKMSDEAKANTCQPVQVVPSDHQCAEAPTFTLGQLRQAIPKHCFERSMLRSFSYLAVDLAVSAAFYYAAHLLDTSEVAKSLPFSATAVAWVLYWIAQGCVQTGLWVIAHECGHGAFSDYSAVNDAVGFVVHSFLLVPYFSWKYTHAKHHAKTGNMEGDEVFVPQTRDQVSDNPVMHSPVIRAIQIVVMLTLGWPLYLLTNVTGQRYETYTSHFTPFTDLFSTRKQKMGVVASDAGIVAMIGAIAYVSHIKGFAWVMKMYGIPYLFVNMWLVLITELQHTDKWLPHFRGEQWNWLRGALATVDRDYGFLNAVFHHIGDTHVCHHIFSYMPHYHAEEATEAIKPILGKYYKMDRTPIAVALWNSFRDCQYVPNGQGTLWFQSFSNGDHVKVAKAN